MQTHIKTGETSQGKMLSGFVNKYLNERGAFNTEVCSYTFGLGLPTKAADRPDEAMSITLEQ